MGDPRNIEQGTGAETCVAEDSPDHRPPRMQLALLLLSYCPLLSVFFVSKGAHLWLCPVSLFLYIFLQEKAKRGWKKAKAPEPSNEMRDAEASQNMSGPPPLATRLRIAAGWAIALGALAALYHVGFLGWLADHPLWYHPWTSQVLFGLMLVLMVSTDLRQVIQHSKALRKVEPAS